MSHIFRTFGAAAVGVLMAVGTAHAGSIEVSAPWAQATDATDKPGAVFMTLTNAGGAPDTLVKVSTPAAEVAQVHNAKMVGDKMRMRRTGGLELPAGESFEMVPGETHIMLVKLAQPLKEGDTLQVTLDFESAGSMSVDVPVKAQGGMSHAKH